MSYGVLVSKTGHLLVETTGGSSEGDSDVVLDRFQAVWGGTWVPGRLTLTRLHLTFVPHRAGRGTAMVDISLRDITAVELGAGRVSRTVGLRTPRHVARIRCLGSPALATQVAGLAEELRKAPRRV